MTAERITALSYIAQYVPCKGNFVGSRVVEIVNMQQFNPRDYGPAVAKVLEGVKTNELGPGSADASLRPVLAALTPESIVVPHKPCDRDMAAACLAGLWLRHDFLDESHRISQDIDSTTGSFWHGIMHRREGDFDNAKYWFRRVGEHEVFAPLCISARKLAEEAGGEADVLQAAKRWDPMRFVDLCRTAVATASPLATLCQKIQRAEWEFLFDHCFHQAIGK